MASLVGWAMIVLGGTVLFLAFPGEWNNALTPGFIGAVGLPFAIVFGAMQCAMAAYFRKPRVYWLVVGLFVVGALLSTLGWAIDIHGFLAEHGISYVQYVLCGGVCTSGLGFGIAIVRGWVYDQAD